MYWLVLAGHCSPVVRWSGGAEARAARVSRDHIRWRTRVAEEAWRVARGACNAAMHRGAKPTQPQERKLANATREPNAWSDNVLTTFKLSMVTTIIN